jgi:protein SCO1/2
MNEAPVIRILSLGLLLVTLQSSAWAHSPQPAAASSVVITREVHTPLDGHFALMDQNGRAVSDGDFRGMPLLIYFGYTNCPDTCPLDTQTISAAVDILDARGQRVTPIFITVDPERDTPSRLKTFLAAFHPRFVGLTGAVGEIRRVTAAYGAEDDRINEKPSGDYDMLHPAIAYLMGRKGEFLDLIPLKDDPQQVAEAVAALLKGDY